MYSASEIRKDASSDCCASMVKLLKLTEVGEEMLKSGPRNSTPEEISDAFLYEAAMIDDVLNFIVNELGETNVVINGDPV